MNFNTRRKGAFTLIELLVVVLILSILLAIAIPQYLSSVANSKLQTANSNCRMIATAVQASFVNGGGTAYAQSIGGTVSTDIGGIPTNPCTGTALATDWVFSSKDAYATGVTITPAKGTCTSQPTAVVLGNG